VPGGMDVYTVEPPRRVAQQLLARDDVSRPSYRRQHREPAGRGRSVVQQVIEALRGET